MSIIRSYFSDNTTLLRNNYTNNSRNAVFELSYGGNTDSGNTLTSRYLLKFDLNNLIGKLTNNEILQSQISSHKIKIKNVISESKDKVGGKFLDAYRGSNVNIITYPINESWVEGTGYEFIYNPPSYNPNLLNTTPSNWYYKDSGVLWNEFGSFSGLTPNIILDTQYIQDGSEDLELDITDYVNSILFSGVTNNGVGICFDSNTETFGANNRYVLTFFSKYTQTFYEPYLETSYNQVILDNRDKFTLDNNQSLYFYPKDTDLVVDKVIIYDYNDDVYDVLSGNSITMVKNNVFKIDLNIDSSTYPDLVNFRDVWYYTATNSKQYNFEQEFTLFNNDSNRFNKLDFTNNNFSLGFNGITYNEKIQSSQGVRKINIITKRLYNSSIQRDLFVDNLQYRIYNQQGHNIEIEIIPWTNVNLTSNEGNFIELDPSWLIPQFYFIEFKLTSNNYVYKPIDRIKFQIVSENN